MANHQFQTAIDAFVRCARECEHCGNMCEMEPDAYLRAECIRLDRDCAEICWTTAAFLLHDSPFAEQICRLCAEVCTACVSSANVFRKSTVGTAPKHVFVAPMSAGTCLARPY